MNTTSHVKRAPRCPAGEAARPCHRPAGFATQHPGNGECRVHELMADHAARRAALGTVPPAVFREALYVDGLSYHDTAPSLDDEGDEDDSEWGFAA